MASFSERRKTVRIAIQGNLTVENLAGGEPLELVDVGTGGFAVTTHSPLPLDTVGNYRFSTADKKWTALFRARALHSKFLPEEGKTPPRFMTGFMFANMEAAAVQREIMALMDHATNYVSFS
jgi:hypothetical protein